MGEFDLIERYFTRDSARDDVLLGVGDDAALVNVGPGNSVACALVSACIEDSDGENVDAEIFAHALTRAAFNRLAAQGVAPAWITLSLCLPKPQPAWVEKFSEVLHAAASIHGAALIGGDTTRGPLGATLIAHGPIPATLVERNRKPAPRDAVYMTGELGRGLMKNSGHGVSPDRIAGDQVPPRVDAGLTAARHVSAAADIRLSLAATLNALLGPFQLGAELDAADLPIAGASGDLSGRKGAAKLLVETSDDSELCFVVPPNKEHAFRHDMQALTTACTRIGVVVEVPGIRVRGCRQ